jgi:hypothetical protein
MSFSLPLAAALAGATHYALPIVVRSFQTAVKANTRSIMIATRDFCRRNGWEFHATAIDARLPTPTAVATFDRKYMQAIYEFGEAEVQQGAASSDRSKIAHCSDFDSRQRSRIARTARLIERAGLCWVGVCGPRARLAGADGAWLSTGEPFQPMRIQPRSSHRANWWKPFRRAIWKSSRS